MLVLLLVLLGALAGLVLGVAALAFGYWLRGVVER